MLEQVINERRHGSSVSFLILSDINLIRAQNNELTAIYWVNHMIEGMRTIFLINNEHLEIALETTKGFTVPAEVLRPSW